MLLNNAACFVNLASREACVLRQINRWFKPEFGLAILALDMHMHSRFLAREEIEAKTAFAKYGWTHEQNDTRLISSRKRRLILPSSPFNCSSRLPIAGEQRGRHLANRLSGRLRMLERKQVAALDAFQTEASAHRGQADAFDLVGIAAADEGGRYF